MFPKKLGIKTGDAHQLLKSHCMAWRVRMLVLLPGVKNYRTSWPTMQSALPLLTWGRKTDRGWSHPVAVKTQLQKLRHLSQLPMEEGWILHLSTFQISSRHISSRHSGVLIILPVGRSWNIIAPELRDQEPNKSTENGVVWLPGASSQFKHRFQGQAHSCDHPEIGTSVSILLFFQLYGVRPFYVPGPVLSLGV